MAKEKSTQTHLEGIEDDRGKSQVRSPLRYPGGKSRATKQILSLIPDFDEYREPFLGGGSIYIATIKKFPKKQYWINDNFKELYCFWSQLKKNSNKVIKEIQLTFDAYKDIENGEELYNKLVNLENYNEQEAAVRFFVLNRITFSGTIESGGFSNESFNKRFTQSSIDRLSPFKELLKNTKITCKDYSYLTDYQGEKVFMFLDPPYLSTKSSKLYGKKGDMHTSFDGEKFAEKAKSSKHKWLITFDDSKEVRSLFKGYNIFPLELQYGMNNYKQKIAAKGKELIITNYEPRKSQ